MAPLNSNSNLLFVLLFTLLGVQCVRGAIKCEELPVEMCAFSVSTTGARCVLEKYVTGNGNGTHQFQCQASVVISEKLVEWIESEECLNVCGLERMSVGISSDSLFEADFTRRLCSPSCQHSCPNILDLYLNLAAAEAINFNSLCEAHHTRSRREMVEILSSAKSNGVNAEFSGQSTGRFGHVKGILAALGNLPADGPSAQTPPADGLPAFAPADGPSAQTPPAFGPSAQTSPAFGPPAEGPSAQTSPAFGPPARTPPTSAPINGPPAQTPPTSTPVNGPPARTPPTLPFPPANGPPAQTPPTFGPPTRTPPTFPFPPANGPSAHIPPAFGPPGHTPPTFPFPPAHGPSASTPPGGAFPPSNGPPAPPGGAFPPSNGPAGGAFPPSNGPPADGPSAFPPAPAGDGPCADTIPGFTPAEGPSIFV